jgi:NAD(P)-dependent dehydrogenase (short-subunit alcohol dehydrogenase family)
VLAREGASVVLNGRDTGRLADAEQRLLALVPGASVRTITADVSTVAGVDHVVGAVPDVNILIYGAATFGPEAFAEIPDAEWTRVFETNVISGVRLSRHYLTRMLAHNDGRILFISGEAAVHVTAGQLHDAVAKTSLLALCRGLAELPRGTAVTVNAVLPGPTATEGVDTVIEAVPGQAGVSRDQVGGHPFSTDQAGSLLQRLASPDEVANLVGCLAKASAQPHQRCGRTRRTRRGAVHSLTIPSSPPSPARYGKGSGGASRSALMNSPDPAAAAAPALTGLDPKRWLALSVVVVAQLMIVVDSFIVNIALPHAQADLHFSTSERQWVLTAYTLAFGGLLLLGGRIADRFGRKRVFTIGLTGFAAASALGGVAPDTATLFGARALQGAFAALLAPAALSIITITFTEPKERAKAFGVYGAVAGGGAAIGLILGGVLTQYASWR